VNGLQKTLLTLFIAWGWSGMLAVRADYQIVNLGTLGGTASVAHAINERGHVVGWSWDHLGRQQAFMWRDGSMTGLGFIPGSTTSIALAINDMDNVTGTSLLSPTNQKAFLYYDGSITSIGTLGGSSSIGRGINNQLAITGWAQSTNNSPSPTDPQSFFWQSNVMHRITPYHNYSSCEGNAINDTGMVAGITAVWTPNLRWWAYVWMDSNGNHSNDNGEMKLLGTLGGLFSFARGMNDRNQIVGTAQNAQFISRAFIVTETGGVWKHPPPEEIVITNALMIDLGSLAGSNGTSEAYAINNPGSIVGTSSSTNGDRAVIWKNGALTDLNAILPTNSGWVLQVATGINERDEITGYGTFEGQTRAFLLHRPARITDFGATYQYETFIATNELDEVYTQLLPHVESMKMNWSSVWSDPPTNHTFILEYQAPEFAPHWQTASVVFSDTVLTISTNDALVQQYTSMWYRMKAIW